MPGDILALILAVVVILGLLGIIFIQFWFIKNLSELHDKKVRDLLDRVMVRNYETFIQAETMRKEAERPAMTDEEIYRQSLERGIPV